MRLFIAINFSEEINISLEKIIQGLKGFARQGNFTRRENLHLTLAFIGETTKIAAVKKALDGVSAPKFKLILGGLGKFHRDGGDIYWLGVEQNAVLSALYSQIWDLLSDAGFSGDRREYKPHLTLGRQVLVRDDFREQAFARSIPELCMETSKISLMKSERIKGKLIYTEIHRKTLG